MAKSNCSKRMHLLALQNTAAFIENHGEEGGMEEGDYEDQAAYLRSAKLIAKRIFAEADRYARKWKLYTENRE